MAVSRARARGPKRILFVVDQMDQCAWYRCSVPGHELAKLGHDVGLVNDLSDPNVSQADIVVFLRQFSPPALRLMQAAKSAGKLVVYDIDDALWNLDPAIPAYAFYSQPEIKRGIHACIREADLVTTSTKSLATKLKGLNAHVTVLPNMLPEEVWPFSGAKPQSDEHVILGWGGGPSHFADLAIIRDVGAEILDTYPNAWLVCAGLNPTPFAPHPRLRIVSPVPIEEYSSVLASFDIGLAPLADSTFNRSKSDLKALEYSMTGIPVVASDVEAYRSFVREGETGFLAKTPGQWRDALASLIEDRALRERMGGAAQSAARERLIGKTVGLWLDAYGLSASHSAPLFHDAGRSVPEISSPPSSAFLDWAKDRHLGETCYIVGKGPSIAHLTKDSFGEGPVICLNEAILRVERLGLKNQVYSMQKDGCEAYHQRDVGCPVGCSGDIGPMVYPDDSVTVLLHEHESKNCLPNHPDRIVFDSLGDLGFGWWSTSAPCAIRIAKIFGCEKVVLLCHDSFFGDHRTADLAGGEQVGLVDEGPGASNYQPIRELVERELADICHEIVPPASSDSDVPE